MLAATASRGGEQQDSCLARLHTPCSARASASPESPRAHGNLPISRSQAFSTGLQSTASCSGGEHFVGVRRMPTRCQMRKRFLLRPRPRSPVQRAGEGLRVPTGRKNEASFRGNEGPVVLRMMFRPPLAFRKIPHTPPPSCIVSLLDRRLAGCTSH